MRSLLQAVAVVGLVVTTGCQTVDSDLPTLFGEQTKTSVAAPTAAADEAPTFSVEIRESGRKPELIKLPCSEALYVQQVLEQVGAVRKFRRMNLQLYRELPNGGGHRLDIPFDRAARRVPSGADYAIHAKDRLVITEDTSTVLDDMLGGLSAPISKGAK